MKIFLTLSRFYLQSSFWMLLFQVVIYLSILFVFPQWINRTHIGIWSINLMVSQALLAVMFTFSLGQVLFLGISAQTDWKLSANAIPHAEFLISRPITRGQAYWTAAGLFFLVVLIPALASWALGMAHPELRIDAHGDAEAVTSVFPNAVNEGKEIVVPDGNALLQGWQLWVITLGALSAQVLYRLPIPMKLLRFATFLPMALYFSSSFQHGPRTNAAFVFFTHQWQMLAVATVLLFAAVQIFAWQRAAKIEVL